jgi:hypothetical protein
MRIMVGKFLFVTGAIQKFIVTTFLKNHLSWIFITGFVTIISEMKITPLFSSTLK